MIDEKLLLISHVADPDGITPIILAKMVYKEVDVILLNPNEVDAKLEENIDKYNLIHITDLSITELLAKKIEDEYKDKVKLFDHHKTALNLNKFSFAKVVIEEDNKKQSATSIYYKYLLKLSNNKLLHKKVVKQLVEQVRIIDTYDFKTENDKMALNLEYLFSILGRDNYVDYFRKYIKNNDEFKYTEKENYLIKLQKDKIDNYIKQKEEEVIFAKYKNYKIALVYAESNRSILGNYLLKKYDIDFSIIINISKGISYRGNDKVDLSIIAKEQGGGGHKNASGSPLPTDILEKITKYIYKDIEIIKEDE